MTDTQIILTSGTSFTTPPDWNPSANTVEVIGGGQNGGATAGGNGADYAKVSNVSLSGAIAYAIGQPGTTGGDTTFGSVLLAKGGGSACSMPYGNNTTSQTLNFYTSGALADPAIAEVIVYNF